MMSNKKLVTGIFVFLGLLIFFDMVLLAALPVYRESLGNFSDVNAVLLFYRLAPGAALLAFYLLFLLGRISPRSAQLYCLSQIFFGLATCVPWIGVFFTPFVSIGVVYLAASLWLPLGFEVGIVVSLIYSSYHVYLLRYSKWRK